MRYLGDFVEGLNKEQLRISILDGKVEIYDLRIKTSALNKLGLPVYVKEGIFFLFVVV